MHIWQIGCMGMRRCYVDISEEEAIAKFLKTEEKDDLDNCDTLEKVEVNDGEFCAYSIWGAE